MTVSSDPRITAPFAREPLRPALPPALVWVPCWRCGGQRREFLRIDGEWRWRTCTRCEGGGVVLEEVRP